MSLALVPAPAQPSPPCRYRPREAFRSPLWRIVVDHLETFLATYDSRYRHSHGPLRPEVRKAFSAFTECGDPNLGVSIFKCSSCRVTLAVPFSCKERICPSCVARKAYRRALLEGLLGPTITVVMGIVVAVLLIGSLLPMLQLVETL